jgi:hypothetical protein
MPPDEPQQSEAPMRPAPQEPPHAEPQAGDVAMENTELDENFKSELESLIHNSVERI